jgi:hypothetical protein
MIISSFLDNIAAALIGGTIAIVVFKNRVHIGYIAAIVAASNAGGSGSVVGDTTTTMMWIDGVSPFNVLHAFIAAAVAMLFFGWFAAHQQHKFQPIQKDATAGVKVDWLKIHRGYHLKLSVRYACPWSMDSNCYRCIPAAGTMEGSTRCN